MTKQQNTKHENLKPSGFASHFRLLGLNRGECRTHVIRSAAQAMSIALSHNESPDQSGLSELSDRRRARIAFAAYRLLDPRERRDLYERVQLSYPIDREDASEECLRASGIDLALSETTRGLMSLASAAKAGEGQKQVSLMSQPLMAQAFDGSVDESFVQAELVPQPEPISDGDDWQARIKERRGIVRLIRELDRLEPRPGSTLDWIRTRLGI